MPAGSDALLRQRNEWGEMLEETVYVVDEMEEEREWRPLQGCAADLGMNWGMGFGVEEGEGKICS